MQNIANYANNFDFLIHLPEEISFQIINCLPKANDVATMSSVCLAWNNLTRKFMEKSSTMSGHILMLKQLGFLESNRTKEFKVLKSMSHYLISDYPSFLLAAYRKNPLYIQSFDSADIVTFCVKLKGPMDAATEKAMHKEVLVKYNTLKNNIEYRKNTHLVLASIMNDPATFLYASQEIREDPDIAYIACVLYEGNFSYVSLNLKKDANFILKIIQHSNWIIYDDIDLELKQNESFILEYVKIRPEILSRARAFNDNDLIAEAAVKRNGLSLQWLSERLKGTESIVKTAYKQNKESLKFATKDLQEQITKSSRNSEIAFRKGPKTLYDRYLMMQ